MVGTGDLKECQCFDSSCWPRCESRSVYLVRCFYRNLSKSVCSINSNLVTPFSLVRCQVFHQRFPWTQLTLNFRQTFLSCPWPNTVLLISTESISRGDENDESTARHDLSSSPVRFTKAMREKLSAEITATLLVAGKVLGVHPLKLLNRESTEEGMEVTLKSNSAHWRYLFHTKA